MTRILQNKVALMTIVGATLSACTATTAVAPLRNGTATIPVPAATETSAVATANADAADDPAIWAAPGGTTVSLNGTRTTGFIAGTDKKAGLYIFDFDGRQLQFLADGLLNNVDLREDVVVDRRRQVVLGASDRGRMGIALYLYDPAGVGSANAVTPWGFIKSDVAEPYGFCIGKLGEELHAVLVGKDGQVRQYQIAPGATPSAIEVRRFAVGSQAEGCVFDDKASRLYIGEELKGVWRYGAAASAGDARDLVEGVAGPGRLVADVEGVTMIHDGKARYLLVSSQGDSAFAVWRVDGGQPVYAGRFNVSSANGIDAVTGTDGIDARGGRVGPFPEGLVVVQDDENEGLTQNFKLVDWREIRSALGLRPD